MNKAVDIIGSARSCLFLTSAGMSAESGIPTFRDKEGYWRNFPAYKNLKLEAVDLANPRSFKTRPSHAWAFYEWRRRNAKENKPHEGYTAINSLIDNHFENSFIHTTNTDGYHMASGTSADHVYEIHGSIWRLQCMAGLGCSYTYEENEDVPLCGLDYDMMTASNLPMCPKCGGLLRPHVLMFGDFDYVEHAYQYNNFRDFLERAGIPDVAILIGSSGSVPTNDYLAVRLQASGCKIITINPDESSLRVCKPDVYIQSGARAAMTEIVRELRIKI